MFSQNVEEKNKTMVRLRKSSLQDSAHALPQIFGLFSVWSSVPPLVTAQRKIKLNKKMKCGTKKGFMMNETEISIPKKKH